MNNTTNATSRGVSKSRWMLERERCRIADHYPPPPDPGAIGLASGVERVLKRLGLEQANKLSSMAQDWPSIVGKQVGRHSRPGMLRGKELVVYVDSSVWLNELKRFGSGTILSNLQQYLGNRQITSLRWQLDPDH